jgi:gluconolactonase
VVLGTGRVAFVQQVLGRVSLYEDGRVATISEGPGAPNAVTLGSDGLLYVAQNGGVVGNWRSQTPCAPGLQRISLGGHIETLVNEIGGVKLGAPNDLVFGPDGRLYFTDPAEPYNPLGRHATNRLFAIGQSGGEVVIELEPAYTNGLTFTVEDRLCWVESYDRYVCLLVEGRRAVLCQLPDEHVPDGLDVANDGRLFISTLTSHGITVVSPEGRVIDHLYLDDDALPTNCCFEGSVMWVSDFGMNWEDQRGCGRLWRLETDAVGVPPREGWL